MQRELWKSLDRDLSHIYESGSVFFVEKWVMGQLLSVTFFNNESKKKSYANMYPAFYAEDIKVGQIFGL